MGAFFPLKMILFGKLVVFLSPSQHNIRIQVLIELQVHYV